ncbi:hypothetical protein NM208_g1116 [Fusarium decemcellulare]|uniref:Uncharacterized protein n=1 Tax=Fusarium decemcellulare TaxID=57161 RepID=A0ACC1SX80_9HYPO|nr:hypothetical protein NM208_g1116 [Fusarium decemcellulare]
METSSATLLPSADKRKDALLVLTPALTKLVMTPFTTTWTTQMSNICYEEFTAGQESRIHSAWTAYRQ